MTGPFSTSAATRQPAAGGMVASSHPIVSDTGAAVLASGGTAGDAALAMAAMCFVTLPGQCGIGGDTFIVWHEGATGRYAAVQGSGTGPDGADIDYYRTHGLATLPLDGPLSVAVPGAPAAMMALSECLGTIPLATLWAPAIAAARDGLPLSEKTRADIQATAEKLVADPATATTFLPNGSLPDVGVTFRQLDLANTLEHLAGGLGDFYHGDIARRCVAALREGGAPFSGREWSSTSAPTSPTIHGPYGRFVVHENPPPSPGYMVLEQLALLDGLLGELPRLSGQAVCLLTAAALLAFAERRRRVGSDSSAWQDLLAPTAIAAGRRRLVAEGMAGSPMRQIIDGDTTSFVAVDAMDNAVSYIHSLAYTFGAGVTVPGTGIVLNDRLGRGAYLVPGHPNALEPGRKPMHTLNAWIVAGGDGRPQYVGNTPGGDGQVQWNVQVLSHLLDHGSHPQDAVDAPRFTVYPGSDADAIGHPLEVRCESRLGTEAIDALRRAGNEVTVQPPWDGGGSAQVIAADPTTGEWRGGSDSRFGGGIRRA